MIRYRHPTGVHAVAGPPARFHTGDGGVVITDEPLQRLWAAAPCGTKTELADRFASDASLEDIVPEALACLSEARLLERGATGEELAATPWTSGRAVSALVIVSAMGELAWLEACLESLVAVQYEPLQIVVVDNASGAPVAAVVHRHCRDARVLTVSARMNLARACNLAVTAADGEDFLFLNPDVSLRPGALAHLVARARAGPRVAAVVPKTLFWFAPAFLNGIGNRISREDWGTDNGIGHLDLGQFDGWRSAQSASLTIMLVPREAWEAVGPFDEAFPAYYEDAEWSYRARMLGWHILAAPDAQALHVFGGYWTSPDGRLSAGKLRTAVHGRLRFTLLLPRLPLLADLCCRYARQDARNAFHDLRTGRRRHAASVCRGWASILASAPEIVRKRWALQKRRELTDATLFPPDSQMPRPLTERNAPILTTDVIRREYAPLIRSGRTRPLPERPRPAPASGPPRRG